MFKRISYQIAAQFTAFVFLLLLLTGMIFLIADMQNSRHQTTIRLQQLLQGIIAQARRPADIPVLLPPLLRERVRIVDARAGSLFSGALYSSIPFDPKSGVSHFTFGNETYAVLTAPFLQDGDVVGYLQVADQRRDDDLPLRALLFLLVSAAVSAATFGVGLFFARRSLKPAEQMVEQLEQFTQDASHELRTPLTAVSTSLDLALASGEFKSNVTNAKKELREVSILIERLLELARLDKFLLRKESVDLSQLVKETTEKHRPFAQEKNVTIVEAIAPGIRVSGDPSLVRQIVSNLLANAIKFNKEGGRIDLKLTPHILSVRDTGTGISKDALPHVFDRFYQEDRSRTKGKEGLGLGLALVKRIAELHGWTVSVQSKQAEGTVFTVHLSQKKSQATSKDY